MNTAEQFNSTVTMAVTLKTTDENGRFYINRKLLPMKAHLFLFFGSFAGIGPALILTCSKIGMSMSEIGTLYAVLPFIQFLSKTIFGVIADKYQAHKTAFMGSILIMGIFLFSFNFIPLPSDNIQTESWIQSDDFSTFECRRQIQPPETLNGSGLPVEMMILTVCDHNNTSSKISGSITANCNVSCHTTGLENISVLFCDKDDLNCLSNDRYSFYETSTKVQSAVEFSAISSSSGLIPELMLNNDTSCLTLPIMNATIYQDPFQMPRSNKTTLTRCYLPEMQSDIRLRCHTVCTITRVTVKLPDKTLQYIWICISLLFSWCAYGTLMSTSDTIIMFLLGDKGEHYGKTRLFGSLGWGLMAPIVGLIIDEVSEGKPEKDYSPGFYLFGVFMLVDFLINIPTKVIIPEKSQKIVKDLIGVFRQPMVILIAFAVFVNGMNTGFLWTFLIVFTNELSGGQQLIIGLNYAVECFLSEIPFFVVSGWVVGKIGHAHSMTLSLFCNGLKSFIYSLLYNPWYILGVALMHGVTYGLLYASMVSYINKIAPPGTSATMQGIFQGIYEGIGVAVGNLLGGHAYQNLGGRQAFLLFGLICIGASIIHFIGAAIINRFIDRKQKPPLGKIIISSAIPIDGPKSFIKSDDEHM